MESSYSIIILTNWTKYSKCEPSCPTRNCNAKTLAGRLCWKSTATYAPCMSRITLICIADYLNWKAQPHNSKLCRSCATASLPIAQIQYSTTLRFYLIASSPYPPSMQPSITTCPKSTANYSEICFGSATTPAWTSWKWCESTGCQDWVVSYTGSCIH